MIQPFWRYISKSYSLCPSLLIPGKPPQPCHCVPPSSLCCASSGDDCDHPECWLFLHLPAAAAAAPRSVAVLTHSLQHCSTAALQTLATCSLQCCSAGTEYTQTLRSAARLLLQSTLSHCTPTAALQHVLRTQSFA